MSDNDVAISVDHVTKTFALPHERTTSLKDLLLNFYKKRRTYEKQTALKDISFEIKKGEFFGIVGRNGSGKSTLLKLLAGIYSPSEGVIQVNGKLTPFIELGVGFNPELTGRENVFLNGALLGFTRKEMEAMYDDIVEFAEIERFMDQRLKNYSSGMQVRLAFSIAIRAKSDILLIDEVLAVGDAGFQSKCFEYFRTLKEEKQTVVFVSHDMHSVEEFCDRALLIDLGDLKMVGDTSDIASQYLLDVTKTTSKPKKANADPNQDAITLKKLKVTKPSHTFSPDETVELSIDYEVLRPVDYEIGVTLVKNGVGLHEGNSRAVDLPTTVGKHTLTWKAPAAALLEGIYLIHVGIFSAGKDFKLLSFINDADKFVIERKDDTQAGMITMNSSWNVEK
jgi:ABC-2 type transport system ATP-binding protein